MITRHWYPALLFAFYSVRTRVSPLFASYLIFVLFTLLTRRSAEIALQTQACEHSDLTLKLPELLSELVAPVCRRILLSRRNNSPSTVPCFIKVVIANSINRSTVIDTATIVSPVCSSNTVHQ